MVGTTTAGSIPMRTRGNILVLGLPTVIALWFLYSVGLTYVSGDRGNIGIYEQRRGWLFAHIIVGTLALLSGPVQLWLGLNRRNMNLHRALGVVYIVGVVSGAITAFYLASHTDFGWVFGLGMSMMATTWVLTTAFAAISIYRRNVEQHREWVIRSYVVTFGFVTFRVLEWGLEIGGAGTILERMTAASWLAWIVPLMITESILQGRKIFSKSAPLVRVQNTTATPATPAVAPFEPRASLPITSSIADDLIARYSIGKK
jgi:uncharacterized membrane protein